MQYDLKHTDENQVNFVEYLNEIGQADYHFDTKAEFDIFKEHNLYKFSTLEWQPNYFAACVLVPKKTLIIELKKLYTNFKITQLGSTLQNLSDGEYYGLVCKVADVFKVSKTMLMNRISSLGYRQKPKFNNERGDV